MMMDSSLPADESGLSDLSAASITSLRQQYVGTPSPSIDAHLAPTTPMPRSVRADTESYVNATPGPSRISADKANQSGAAWTPSPDASSSRSKSSNRSIHRPSSRNGNANSNESMGSSLGAFDYSNASFSESFLRQAGAHMLAGLDETDLPPASTSSSSPRYRTSSSPTVTARPVRIADPRTPFTGKSLRTRMAEAGVIDSPASSDGSSPTTSPTARMLPDSYTRSIASYQPDVEHHSPQPTLGSPQEDRSQTAYSPSVDRIRSPSVHRIQHSSASSPLRCESPTAENTFGMSERGGWQEGLSMVPEESYVEEVSQLPSTPIVQDGSAHRSMVFDDRSSRSVLRSGSLELNADASSSVPAPDQSAVAGDDASSNSAPSLEEHPGVDSASSPFSDTRPEQDYDISSSNTTKSVQASPRSSPAPPATASSAPRAVNTPLSFARLRVGTPVRSSPLSRVVDFSPASSVSAASQWQSPVSQRSHDEAAVSSPLPATGEAEATSIIDLYAAPTKHQQMHSAPMSPAISDRPETNREQRISQPQTPSGITSAQQAFATPSLLWSPATSASFATPASQRPQQPSAPATPAFSQPFTPEYRPALTDAFSSPAAHFGTPQWSPSPPPVSAKIEPVQVQQDKGNPDTGIKEPIETEQEEALSSSACSSASGASEKKQSGDVSTCSQPAIDTSRKEKAPDLSLTSMPQHVDSPSAARFSRMQLSRILPPPSIPSELASVPELGLVASAFDSISHLSDSRVSRLLSQLSASTARIDELEAALEARENEQEELQEVKVTLSQLSLQYRELVQEADAKDVAMAELVKQLQEQLREGEGAKVAEMERKLEEERRLREVDRRDYEVRIQALMNPSFGGSATSTQDVETAPPDDDRVHVAVEQAKEQVRHTLEKDFDVRRAMEQRDLHTRIEHLERQLTCASSTHQEEATSHTDSDLQRQVEQLTIDLDRRFEELADLGEELESTALQRDHAEHRLDELQHELDHRSAPSDTELQEELEELRSVLAEREAQVERLEETLQLTGSRLATVSAERDTLAEQHGRLSKAHSDSEARVGELEGHVVALETQLRMRTPSREDSTPPASTDDAATPPRVLQLERDLASLQLDLVKLGKANDALQQDNVNFSIALSAKQLELGMVKRNARFALKNAAARVQAEVESVGLPKSKVLKEDEFPKVPRGEFGVEVVQEKENVNPARLQARQMLALRRAAGGEAVAGGGRGIRRQRQMLAA